jgi:enoyl-CoA hydratase/carnithine racemase
VTLVRIEEQDDIAIVTIDRPPANALDPSLVEEGVAVLEQLAVLRPRAVVLTGAGAFFSGGADLRVVPALGPDDQARMARGANEVFRAWYAYPGPLVTAVNGHAVAGGLVLALCGDVRIAATTGRYGLTEVKVGIPYPPSAMAIVGAELTPSVARRLVLRGELFDSRAMLEFGVFDEVVADDEVLPRALEMAREMSELPQQTYGVIKRSLRREALKAAEDRRSDDSLRSWLSSETADASAAVLDKRS